MMRRPLLAWAAAVSLVLAPTAAAGEHWTRAWTSSLWQGNERQVVAVENRTLRSEVRIGAGGDAVRVWLANDFGRMPIRITAVALRTPDGRFVPVRFWGRHRHASRSARRWSAIRSR